MFSNKKKMQVDLLVVEDIKFTKLERLNTALFLVPLLILIEAQYIYALPVQYSIYMSCQPKSHQPLCQVWTM